MSFCLNDKDNSYRGNPKSIEPTVDITSMQGRYCEYNTIENIAWREKELAYLHEIEYLREQIQDIVSVCEDQYNHKEMALKYINRQQDSTMHEQQVYADQRQLESPLNSQNQLCDKHEIVHQWNKLLTEAEEKETKEMKEFADQREELERLTFRRIQLQENIYQVQDQQENTKQEKEGYLIRNDQYLQKQKLSNNNNHNNNNAIIQSCSQVEIDQASENFVSPMKKRHLQEVETTHTTAADTVSQMKYTHNNNLSSSHKEQQSNYLTTEYKKNQQGSADCYAEYEQSPQPISTAFDSQQNEDASEQVLNIITKLRKVMKLKEQLLSPVQQNTLRIQAAKVFEQQFDQKMEELQWQISSQKDRKSKQIVTTTMNSQ